MAVYPLLNSQQIPDYAVSDINGKQLYLGRAYSASIKSANSTSTSEVPFMLLSNPSSNQISAFHFARSMSVNSFSAAATCIFRFYANPTVTSNGTVITPVNNRINAASPASLMMAYNSPVISSNGNFLVDMVATSAAGTLQTLNQFIIDPGQSVLITVTASATNIPLGIQMLWYEV